MNEIINKFLLAGDKFMPELLLKQPGETGDLKHIYKNELDKPCFEHVAVYSNSKDLSKRTASDKILKIELTKLL